MCNNILFTRTRLARHVSPIPGGRAAVILDRTQSNCIVRKGVMISMVVAPLPVSVRLVYHCTRTRLSVYTRVCVYYNTEVGSLGTLSTVIGQTSHGRRGVQTVTSSRLIDPARRRRPLLYYSVTHRRRQRSSVKYPSYMVSSIGIL